MVVVSSLNFSLINIYPPQISCVRQLIKPNVVYKDTTGMTNHMTSIHHQEFFAVQTSTVYCCLCSEKLLTMDRGTARNMQSYVLKTNLSN